MLTCYIMETCMEKVTDKAWDFIFCGGPYPESSDIPSSVLNKMKQEFEYWYPFDLRVSESSLRTGPPSTFADRLFENEINIAVRITEQHYENYMFREVLKSVFYELQAARDEYRIQLGLEEVGILSVADPDALAKAGSLASLLKQNPASPGKPTAVFMTK
ncbi:hypothetical protein Ddye_008274 [Dipteronia dyeriana]|uniref:Uncharacterized protein n=1 Tax=Dipteronia dyeriana TaxID=168575 RepID=A0AAD9X9H9_9ROSI|nr:hypothetical protein Ddye_008274 [Dipteronia dyeriana]